jgi:hypothetical protein
MRNCFSPKFSRDVPAYRRPASRIVFLFACVRNGRNVAGRARTARDRASAMPARQCLQASGSVGDEDLYRLCWRAGARTPGRWTNDALRITVLSECDMPRHAAGLLVDILQFPTSQPMNATTAGIMSRIRHTAGWSWRQCCIKATTLSNGGAIQATNAEVKCEVSRSPAG